MTIILVFIKLSPFNVSRYKGSLCYTECRPQIYNATICSNTARKSHSALISTKNTI